MRVYSFKKFLEEEDSKAIVQTGLNSKSIDNSVTKDIINSRLAIATNNQFLTPYIALGSIARVLAYANIIVPQYTFLDRDEGEVVFDATQIGQIAGVNLDGSPARSEADHFIYFSYSMNDDGYYDCFAALVDSDELERIMDMGGDEDVDQFDVDQKVNEENVDEQTQINEISAKTYGNYIRKASRDIEDRAGTVADVKQQKSGFTQGSYYHTHLSNVEKNQQKKVDQRKRGISTATNKLVSKTNEELKGDQHKLDVAEPKGKLTSADFKKLRGEEVDEGFDKWRNKLKKRNFLRKLGYEKSSVDHTSPGNTAAMAVRAGRDKLKKEETQQVDESNWIKTRDGSHYNLHTGVSSISKGEDTSYDDTKNAHDYYEKEVERLRANPNSYKSHIKDAEMMLRRAKKKLGIKEELKGDQHKLDVAEPKGKLTSADFKKLRGEEVDEAADPDDSFARFSYGSRRGNVSFHKKSNTYSATSLGGTKKLFRNQKQAEKHANLDDREMGDKNEELTNPETKKK